MPDGEKEYEAIKELLVEFPDLLLPDRPIAFNREFVDLKIGITGALFLSQALYWDKSKAARDRDGWFYKTVKEWTEETGLTKEEQLSLKKKLQKKGYLEIKLEGVPARNYYRINKAKVAYDLVDKRKSQLSGFPTTRCRKSRQQDVGIPDNIHTEITQESTQLSRGKAGDMRDVIPNGNQPDTKSASLDLKGFVEECRSNSRRHIQLIGEYADQKGLSFTTRGQWNALIKRFTKDAAQMAQFTDEQIAKAYDRMELDMERNDWLRREWHMGTLVKYLTK